MFGAEHAPDNLAVPRDPIQQLAKESVKDPHATDEQLDNEECGVGEWASHVMQFNVRVVCSVAFAYDSRMTNQTVPSRAHLDGNGAVERAVREARAASNAAIVERDADRVVACMMHDVTVAVAHGPTLLGREASRAAFAAQFAERTFKGYVREPNEIVVHNPPTRATERGCWLGRWQHGVGEQVMRGTYVAEWSYTALGWFIQSEQFTPGGETR